MLKKIAIVVLECLTQERDQMREALEDAESIAAENLQLRDAAERQIAEYGQDLAAMAVERNVTITTRDRLALEAVLG